MFTYDLTSAMHIPFALCPTVLQSPAEKDALVSDQPHAASVIYLCLFFLLLWSDEADAMETENNQLILPTSIFRYSRDVSAFFGEYLTFDL